MPPRSKLTKRMRKEVLRRYATHGVFARVADELNIDRRTLWRWRREDPELQAGLDELKDELVVGISEMSANKLVEHLESVGTTVEVGRRHTRDAKGNPYVEVTEELVRLNPALVRYGMTKWHPDMVRVPLTKDEQDKVQSYIQEVLAKRNHAEP